MTAFRVMSRAAFQAEVARAIPLLFEADNELEPVVQRLREAGYSVDPTPADPTPVDPTPALPASGEGASFPPLAGGLRGVCPLAGGLGVVAAGLSGVAAWPGILFQVVRSGAEFFPRPAARRVAIVLSELTETANIHPAISSADGVLCADSRTARRVKQRGVRASVLSFANVVELVARLAPRFELTPQPPITGEHLAPQTPITVEHLVLQPPITGESTRDLTRSGDRVIGAGPSFSIVIAGVDAGRLDRVLESARRQIYPGPVEIIVVDAAVRPAVADMKAVVRQTPSPLSGTAGRHAPPLSGAGGRAGEGSPAADGEGNVCCLSMPGAGPAGARNQGLEMAAGEYVIVLSEAISPWYTLTCARALDNAGLGRLGAVFARARLLGSGAQGDSLEYPDAIPAPYEAPNLDFTGESWCGPGALAFHRSIVESGLRYDETALAGILDDEFRCRLDDQGFRIAELTDCLMPPIPWPDELFRPERVTDEEAAFFERHPHARLRGSRSLALEAVDAGTVDALITVGSGDSELIRHTRLSLERQLYSGKINVIVPENEAGSRLRREGLAGMFVLLVDAGTIVSPQHVQNCVNLLRYQGASCICGSDLAHGEDGTAVEIVGKLARWPGVQPIPMSGIPFGAASPAGALFMSRRMYERAGAELAKPGEATRADDERALHDAGGRVIRMDRLPVRRVPEG